MDLQIVAIIVVRKKLVWFQFWRLFCQNCKCCTFNNIIPFDFRLLIVIHFFIKVNSLIYQLNSILASYTLFHKIIAIWLYKWIRHSIWNIALQTYVKYICLNIFNYGLNYKQGKLVNRQYSNHLFHVLKLSIMQLCSIFPEA